MKLVSKINNMNELNIVANYTDYIMLPYELINIENVNKVTELNKTPILMFNLMVHPFEIEQLTKELLQFKDFNILYYINKSKKLAL